MARKRKSSEQGISLDSLMDALTNVVAVLILVLLLVQADVTRKVLQFLDDLAPATPEEVAESKQKIEELRQKAQITEARLSEKPPSPEVIEEEKRLIELLEKSLEENNELLADLDQLKELAQKIRSERNQENSKTVAIQEEIARITALLDDTPAIQPDTPTIVKIPNSRPIPSDAEIYHAIAWNDRIHIIDPHTPLELFQQEFDRHKNDWVLRRVRRSGPNLVIYDRKKIEAHFKGFDWNNSRNQKIELNIPPTSMAVRLVIKPDLKNGGTPLEDLGKPGNNFANAVAVLRRSFNSVLMFKVHPTSFNSYLKARDLVDDANIAAGWDMSWNQQFTIPIPDIRVERLVQPKPRPPKPRPPKTPGPPPLKPKLD